MKTTLFTLFMFFGVALFAQQFLTPLTMITKADGLVQTTDGRTTAGEVRSAVFTGKGLVSFRVKDSTGTVHKFVAEEVEVFRVKMSKMAKMETVLEQTSSVSRMMKANFDEYKNREFIWFHRVQWPGNPDKFILAQLLNEGWDSKIRVYDFPGRETAETRIGGVAVTGGEQRAYVVQYAGEARIVNRMNFQRDHFGWLFANCPAVLALDPKNTDFRDFALQVFLKETECD